ncbi:hypothetical protein BpHYR1_016280 [Brachionus plicatilis]|uniref:Uncharacterized protein n=1 Tax=Brachionus plicatilis TaxID=10195 RepID=A0A3M7SST8_BRAPC|nr:hypothetical protein BpHYR1_016280 [Brachionus plicatilis]
MRFFLGKETVRSFQLSIDPALLNISKLTLIEDERLILLAVVDITDFTLLFKKRFMSRTKKHMIKKNVYNALKPLYRQIIFSKIDSTYS